MREVRFYFEEPPAAAALNFEPEACGGGAETNIKFPGFRFRLSLFRSPRKTGQIVL